MNYDLAMKNGLIGTFNGYRLGGKSYDADGKEVVEKHPADCFCCRDGLLGPYIS